jgi:polyphosphate kinase 2 (PPK2 family)
MAKKHADDKPAKMKRKLFDKELIRLQTELCHLQDHVVEHKLKAVVVFEGRDAAGKGGVIKRITERVSPGSFGSLPCPNPATGKRPSGIRSATSGTFRPVVRSCCSTAAGTTAPVSNT